MDFLPVAVILGLAMDAPVEVPIVVVAEDGVTSLQYSVLITRSAEPAGMAATPGPGPWASPAIGPEGAVTDDTSGQIGENNTSLMAMPIAEAAEQAPPAVDMDKPLPEGVLLGTCAIRAALLNCLSSAASVWHNSTLLMHEHLPRCAMQLT